MIENPYAPPRADCVGAAQSDMLRELKSQSTWRLLLLGIITYGVYYAHYCARQSKIINRHSGTRLVPASLVLALLILSYASLALFFGYMVVDAGHPVAIASNVTDKLWMILVIIWGFYARNSVNVMAGFTRDDPGWIHGLWTFLFSPLHFNYKINVINRASAAAQAVT